MSTSKPKRTPTGIPHPPGPNKQTDPASQALNGIESDIVKMLNNTEMLEREHPDKKEALSCIFHSLIEGLRKHKPYLLPPTPVPKPTALSTDIKDMKVTLATIQRTVATLQCQLAQVTPSEPLRAPDNTSRQTFPDPNTTTPPPNLPTIPTILPTSTVINARATPSRPSITIHTTTRNPTNCPPLHVLCSTINNTLRHSTHPHIHISSAKWTAKGNIVLTGGHSNTYDQLAWAYNLISNSIISNFPTIREHPLTETLDITANVNWTKILVNGVPTGVDSNRGPWTPDECHEALIADNPQYAALTVTQRPSWVKPPATYKTNTSSSLVFAFEDPLGEFRQTLADNKYLYIFGACATVKPWTQRPQPHNRDTYKHTHPLQPPSTSNTANNHPHQTIRHLSPQLAGPTNGATQETKRDTDNVVAQPLHKRKASRASSIRPISRLASLRN